MLNAGHDAYAYMSVCLVHVLGAIVIQAVTEVQYYDSQDYFFYIMQVMSIHFSVTYLVRPKQKPNSYLWTLLSVTYYCT